MRIRNPEYSSPGCVISPQDLGIEHAINPEPAIVNSLVKMIEIQGCVDVATLAAGHVLMLGFDIHEDSPVAGRALSDIRALGELDSFLILDIKRGDDVIIPRGHDRIQPGDNVHVLVAEETVPVVLPLVQRRGKVTRRAIVYGASRIGVDLAQKLESRINRLTVIEPDYELAQDAAIALPKTIVLKGEGTDLDVLEEAAIEACDLFCALSDDDHRNMLSVLLARRHGAAKTAVLVHQPEFIPVMYSLGVEIVINPRLVTVSEALMHVRTGHVHSVTRLGQSRGEILDIEVQPGSRVVQAPLSELKFPVNAPTSMSASVAALGNVGLGLAEVGPTANWSHLPNVAKWVMSFLMLIGRLEIYSVLVLLTPWAWRR